MRKGVQILLSLLCLSLLLNGCGTESWVLSDKQQLRVVVTVFPAYDWVREILGGDDDDVALTLLMDNGVDLHSYQPTVDDMIAISESDVFIYVGGESDVWVEDALAEAVNPELVAVNLLDMLGDAARWEETVEGMQADETEEEAAYDEHVWLSLRNAAALCVDIAAVLGTLRPERREVWTANAAAYAETLGALDEEYRMAVAAAQTRTLVFGDRFPFRYLMEDYGLSYYAAFPGCSAETEASFETIVFLAEKMDELGLTAIGRTESGDERIPRTIAESTKAGYADIYQMDSLQSTTREDIAGGISYLGAMEENLLVLSGALGN